MKPLIPNDISAEVLINYLADKVSDIEFMGMHKRNAYQDILETDIDDDGQWRLAMSRDSLYDILPEAMFHPIDRFENIPANEYQDRFADECQKQREEETNARRYFKPFDKFLEDLHTALQEDKDRNFASNDILVQIICDQMPKRYRENRFIKRAMPFVASCSRIRGNNTLITLMLRKILCDEGLKLECKSVVQEHSDTEPMYNACVDGQFVGEDTYLGSTYPETVTTYTVHYWSEDDCDEHFIKFVDEIETFVDFVNDYFVSIEDKIEINISTTALPVRLSDTIYYNYLNYNTNL